MNGQGRSIAERVARVKARLPVGEFVGRHVKLSGGAGARNRRGQCPFHGSSSASLAVKDEAGGGFAHCFGCQWHGDVVKFVQDFFSLPFLDALQSLEAEIDGSATDDRAASPVQRQRNPAAARPRDRRLIEPVDMARAIWRRGRRDDDAARRYFLGRGVPAATLTAERLAPFRFHHECPCTAWDAAESWPRKAITAPAIFALVTEPVAREGGAVDFMPVALHVTYLNPAGTGTMVRRKPWVRDDDPDPMLPKRRMLGPVGRGCIVLGDYRPGATLYVGEGNETVLSALGLAIGGAATARSGYLSGGAVDDREIVGIATLSLDNLQGRPKLWRNGVWPLYAIEPDPKRPPFTIPGHIGPVVGLVDSDMSALRGPRRRDGEGFEGLPVVERKGGSIVRRALTGAERARICGELVVKGWRDAGIAVARAVRAPAGMDFNDAAKERATASGCLSEGERAA